MRHVLHRVLKRCDSFTQYTTSKHCRHKCPGMSESVEHMHSGCRQGFLQQLLTSLAAPVRKGAIVHPALKNADTYCSNFRGAQQA